MIKIKALTVTPWTLLTYHLGYACPSLETTGLKGHIFTTNPLTCESGRTPYWVSWYEGSGGFWGL